MKIIHQIKLFTLLSLFFISACTMEDDDENTTNVNKGGVISAKQFTDAIHTILAVDRAVYTKLIISRLAIKEKVIKASEHWKEDKALVLPAQMLRASAEMIIDSDANFSFALLSSWPLNPQNRPRTELEKRGLKFIEDNQGSENFYGEEVLGGIKYFSAIYPDPAVVNACASCHNEHKDSPRNDFKVGEVMGGIIIRIPLN